MSQHSQTWILETLTSSTATQTSFVAKIFIIVYVPRTLVNKTIHISHQLIYPQTKHWYINIWDKFVGANVLHNNSNVTASKYTKWWNTNIVSLIKSTNGLAAKKMTEW